MQNIVMKSLVLIWNGYNQALPIIYKGVNALCVHLMKISLQAGYVPTKWHQGKTLGSILIFLL